MTGPTSDIFDLLRPISAAARAAAAPALQHSRDHAQYQQFVVLHLAPIIRNLEAPLRALRGSSPYIEQDAVDELANVSGEFSRLVDSMSGPSWWLKLVFWKNADLRPTVNKFREDLTGTVTAAKAAQPEFQWWRLSKPHPQYWGDLDPETQKEADKFWARAKVKSRVVV